MEAFLLSTAVIFVAEIVGRGRAAAREQLRHLHDVCGLLVGEPRDREDEVGAHGVAAHQGQRRLRRLALAVQVVLVHGVEVGQRDRQPGRRGRRQRQGRGVHRGSFAVDVTGVKP